MFGKRAKQPSQQEPPTEDGSQTARSGLEPRDATIERLERELADEHAAAQSLREALDAAAFKAQVLEKSYAKQLADAREKLLAMERQLAEKQAVLGALDGGHEDALRALNDARAEVKLVTAERDQLRKQIAEAGLRRRSGSARATLDSSGDDTSDDGGTINRLIANAGWAEQKAPGVGSGHASAKVVEQETPREEMVAPELVFTKKDSDDDDR